MSFRYAAGINKPGFNPLATQTTTAQSTLFSWGYNNYGQLGLSDTTNRSSPTQIGSLSDWLNVSAGYYFTTAIKTDGTIWGWGQNNTGQLGLGNTTNYSSPKQIGALTTWSKISTSKAACAAIKTDGTLWTWGYNYQGQLGLGTSGAGAAKSSPTQVGSLTNWADVTGLNFSVLATKTDGTLWSWGSNNHGQLGLGNTTYYSSPKQVGSLTSWLKVAGGTYAAFAIKTDGTLWSWGWNSYLQGILGLGNTTDYSSPKQVGALTNWLYISAGNYQALAIKTNNTLWSWGGNSKGQLGLNNTTNYSSPMQVGSLTNWLGVAGGAYHSAAVKTDGTFWTWGRNNYGQLGLGTSSNYINISSPSQVGSLTTWSKAISSRAAGHCLGL